LGVVAVDDGSTDGSDAILGAYARRDLRIRVIRTPHRGLVPALNTGLAAARGRLIARMDADDVCMPERLQRQRLATRPDLGLVASRVRFGGDSVRGAGHPGVRDARNGTRPTRAEIELEVEVA
jgi:glycosyltransferase involved in cell wall biosynthesis